MVARADREETLDALVTHARLTLSTLDHGENDGATLGHPPDSIYIQEFPLELTDWNRGHFRGAPIRMWLLGPSGLAGQTPRVLEEADLGDRDGMYWRRGYLMFAVSDDRERVLVGWQVGPRYGRGYIIAREDLAAHDYPSDRVEPRWVS